MNSDRTPLNSSDQAIKLNDFVEKSVDEMSNIFSAARRQKWVVINSVLTLFVLAVLFILQSVPMYTASTSLLIDSKQVGFNASSAFEGALAFETGAVDSQVLVVTSDRIAAAVIDHLDLLHNSAFLKPPQSLLSIAASATFAKINSLLAMLEGGGRVRQFSDYPVDVQRSLLVTQLQNNLKVTRSGRTYVLIIEYSDPDPSLARAIVSTYASAYLQDQLESRFDTARQASTWLDARISEIKAKADAANLAVQAFKDKNNLTEASGRLINDQSLTDANTQLSIARNDLTSAKAKFAQLKTIIDAHDLTGSNIDALANPIISQLRAKYLESSKMNSDITSRLGPQHESAIRARKEMDQYDQLIFDELLRQLKSYQSEVKIASDRVASLELTVGSMGKINNTDSAAISKLKTLEQEASTYQTLYSNYLQKGQELFQQQSIPISDARVITDAALPIKPSSPKVILILLGSIVGGLIIGGGIAALREFSERGFRTSTQVRGEVGIDFVAYVPMLEAASFRMRRKSAIEKDKPDQGARKLRPSQASLTVTVDEPMSRYAEAMRAFKLSTDFHFGLKRPLVLGVISVFPNEGKSTAAKNFASLLAIQGERVLLIDGDLRNPKLTRDLAPTARAGVLEILHDKEMTFDRAVYMEEQSGLMFLPASTRGRVPATGDLLGSQGMRDLMLSLKGKFDIIIMDLPPVGLVLDAVAAESYIDGFHLVVEWGKTPRSAVRDTLASEPIIASRTIGISLSKVDSAKLLMFESTGVYGYVGPYASRYYP